MVLYRCLALKFLWFKRKSKSLAINVQYISRSVNLLNMLCKNENEFPDATLKLFKVCRRTSEDLSIFVVFLIIFIKVCRRMSEDLSVFVVFLIKVCRLRRKTFLFLFCFYFYY